MSGDLQYPGMTIPSSKYCDSCGTTNEQKAVFCGDCGVRLEMSGTMPTSRRYKRRKRRSPQTRMLVDSNLGIKIITGINFISIGGLFIFVFFFIFGVLFNESTFAMGVLIAASVLIIMGFIILKSDMEMKDIVATSVVNVFVIIAAIIFYIMILVFLTF